MAITNEEIEQFKALVLWCKANGVAALALGDMSVSLFPEIPKLTEFNIDDIKNQEEETELLYHSAR